MTKQGRKSDENPFYTFNYKNCKFFPTTVLCFYSKRPYF